MFTYKHYRTTMDRYLKAGYRISSFRDHLAEAPAQKSMILRHDIDLCLNAARNIGEIDAEMAVTSTFFLRLHAKHYNLLSFKGLQFVERLVQLKHEIGLHFEPDIGGRLNNARALEIGIATKSYLETLFGIQIEGMSTHEPARANDVDLVDLMFRKSGLKYHAYEPRFVLERKYLSDSGGRWREDCFSKWVDKADHLQVLIHPFWWYDKASQENY